MLQVERNRNQAIEKRDRLIKEIKTGESGNLIN